MRTGQAPSIIPQSEPLCAHSARLVRQGIHACPLARLRALARIRASGASTAHGGATRAMAESHDGGASSTIDVYLKRGAYSTVSHPGKFPAGSVWLVSEEENAALWGSSACPHNINVTLTELSVELPENVTRPGKFTVGSVSSVTEEENAAMWAKSADPLHKSSGTLTQPPAARPETIRADNPKRFVQTLTVGTWFAGDEDCICSPEVHCFYSDQTKGIIKGRLQLRGYKVGKLFFLSEDRGLPICSTTNRNWLYLFDDFCVAFTLQGSTLMANLTLTDQAFCIGSRLVGDSGKSRPAAAAAALAAVPRWVARRISSELTSCWAVLNLETMANAGGKWGFECYTN